MKYTLLIIFTTIFLNCTTTTESRFWRNEELGVSLQLPAEWRVQSKPNLSKKLRVAEKQKIVSKGLSKAIKATQTEMVFDAIKYRGEGNNQANANMNVLVYRIPEIRRRNFNLSVFMTQSLYGANQQWPEAETQYMAYDFGGRKEIQNYLIKLKIGRLDAKNYCFAHYKDPFVTMINIGYSHPDDSIDIDSIVATLEFSD